MPPIGQRYRHQNRFSNSNELTTAPAVINNNRQLLSQAVVSRWKSSSHSRMAAKPHARSGEAQRSWSPRGQRRGCQPSFPAMRWLISPQTMKGQKEHQSRPTNGNPSRIRGHHQAQKRLRAGLAWRSCGPSHNHRFTATNTQLTRPNSSVFQSQGERICRRSSGRQRQSSKRLGFAGESVQKTSSGSSAGKGP